MTGQKSYGMTDVLPGGYAAAAEELLRKIPGQKSGEIQEIARLTESVILGADGAANTQKKELEQRLAVNPVFSLTGVSLLVETIGSLNKESVIVPEAIDGFGAVFCAAAESQARHNAYSYAQANCG